MLKLEFYKIFQKKDFNRAAGGNCRGDIFVHAVPVGYV